MASKSDRISAISRGEFANWLSIVAHQSKSGISPIWPTPIAKRPMAFDVGSGRGYGGPVSAIGYTSTVATFAADIAGVWSRFGITESPLAETENIARDVTLCDVESA